MAGRLYVVCVRNAPDSPWVRSVKMSAAAAEIEHGAYLARGFEARVEEATDSDCERKSLAAEIDKWLAIK